MRIAISLLRNNDKSQPNLTISCNGIEQQIRMFEDNISACIDVPDLAQGRYELRIARNEPLHALTHDTWVKVKAIMIDEFWTIGENNHWSRTEYDDEYKQHVLSQEHSWELTKHRFNDTIFFNGSLIYDITAPVRGMFWR